MMAEKRILIVDDEPNTRKGLAKMLEVWSAGRYQILQAENGQEAREIVEKEKIHLLITDIRMPEITGLMLVEGFKKAGKDFVVIIISSYSEFTYAQEAIQLGVKNYLLKPLNRQKLIEAVEQALVDEERNERNGVIEKVIDEHLYHIEVKNDQTRLPIKEACQYINDHLNEPLSLRDVSQSVHLNSSYFSFLFKEQMNVTFSEYVTRKRLQAAKKLLMCTDLQIADISAAVGYKTDKYFIKLFKEHEGMTPSKYRKNV